MNYTTVAVATIYRGVYTYTGKRVLVSLFSSIDLHATLGLKRINRGCQTKIKTAVPAELTGAAVLGLSFFALAPCYTPHKIRTVRCIQATAV